MAESIRDAINRKGIQLNQNKSNTFEEFKASLKNKEASGIQKQIAERTNSWLKDNEDFINRYNSVYGKNASDVNPQAFSAAVAGVSGLKKEANDIKGLLDDYSEFYDSDWVKSVYEVLNSNLMSQDKILSNFKPKDTSAKTLDILKAIAQNNPELIVSEVNKANNIKTDFNDDEVIRAILGQSNDLLNDSSLSPEELQNLHIAGAIGSTEKPNLDAFGNDFKPVSEGDRSNEEELDKLYGLMAAAYNPDASPYDNWGLLTQRDKNKAMLAEQDKKALEALSRGWFSSGGYNPKHPVESVVRGIGGTIADTGANLVGGALDTFEGFYDAVALLFGGLDLLTEGMIGGNQNQWGFDRDGQLVRLDLQGNPTDKYVSPFIEGAKEDLIDANFLSDPLDPYSFFGEKTDSLAQSVGQMSTANALSYAGIPWQASMGLSSFSSEATQALNEGANYGEALASGLVSAAAEILSESLFKGSMLGEKGLIDTSKITENISSKLIRTLAQYGVDLASEGAEEVVSEFASRLGSALYKEESLREILASDEALQSYVDSFIGGMIISGATNTINMVDSVVGKKDYTPQLSDEQKRLVDKEIKDRTQEAEADGKILTDKEKQTIKDDVYEEFKSGYLELRQKFGRGDEVVKAALEVNPNNEFANQMLNKLKDGTKSLTGKEMATLISESRQHILDNDIEKIFSAIKKRLTQLGETADVNELARIIIKAQIEQKKLTYSERSVLVNSKYGRRVSTELNPNSIESGNYTSDWAKNIGTTRINPKAYNSTLYNLAEAMAGVNSDTSKASPDATKQSPSLKDTRSKEIVTEDDIDVSKEGKTINLSTGEEITIDKSNAIAKVENGKVYYNTDHGVVEATNVTYASKEDGLLFESFSDMNPAIANAAIKNYDGSVPVQTYIKGMREGILLYGMHNFQAVGKDISADTYFADLSKADQAYALKLGREYAKVLTENDVGKLNTSDKGAGNKADGNTSTTSKKKGAVRFEDGVDKSTLNKLQRRTVKLAENLAKAIGIDIVFYNEATTTDENGKKANGYFDSKDNSIHLDLQNAATDSKTIAFTLSHELVQFIKKWSPAKFKAFADFLMEQYAVHGVSTSQLLERKMGELGTTDADFAFEEMIADACERMLLDSDAVVKLMELRKADLKLFEKIKKHILDLLGKIRNAFKGVDPNTEEGIALQKMEDVLGKLHEMFEDAAVDAAKTYQTAKSLGVKSVSDGIKKQVKRIVGESGTDYGVGVYLDSNLLTDLTDDERVEMVKEYVKELGGSVFTAYDKNGNAVDVHIVESYKKYKNEQGKRVFVNQHLTNYNKNPVKQEAIALVDELILTARYENPEPARHSHGWVDNQGKNDWDAWTTYLQDKENTVWKAKLQIANSVNGEKILYEIHPIEMVEGIAKRDTTTTDKIIPQEPDSVKRQMKKDSEGNILSEEQMEFFKDSKVRDEEGRLLPMYHGTNAKFTVFRDGEKNGWLGKGIYFAGSRDYAKTNGKTVIKAYLNVKNPFVAESNSHYGVLSEIKDRYPQVDEFNISEVLRQEGFDGILYTDWDKGKIIVVYESEQIKLTSNKSPKYDTDIRYQKKTTTNRSLLANALESAAKEGEERNTLRNYKTNLRALEAEQKRLDNVRSQLRELRKEANRTVDDNKQIEALEVEAKRTTNRINAYENEIVKLESSKYLKNVLQREKEDIRNGNKQKGENAFKAYREKIAAQNVTDMRAKYQEWRSKASASRSKTKLKGNVRKLVKSLTSLLDKGNKKRNIKTEEQGVVASALALSEILLANDITNEDIVMIGVDDALDSESVLLNEYRDLITQRDDYLAEIDSYNANGVVNESDEGKMSNARDEVEKIKRRISELNKELASVFERERTRLNGSTIDKVINDLISEYAMIAKSDKGYIKNAYSQAVYERLTNLKASLGGKIVRDMDIYQLTELYDTLKMIEHMVRKSNKLFIDGKLEDLKSKVSAVEEEVMTATNDPKEHGVVVSKLESAFREFSWNNLRPIDAFERLGSPTFEKLFWNFVDGMTEAGQLIRESGEVIAEARKKYNYSEWKLDEVSKTFTTRDGLVFKPTLADKLSIYAYSQRDQAEKHMIDGGFVFDTGATYKGVKNGKTYVRKKLSQTYRMDDITIGSIIASLTQEQRGYVDAILPIFTALGEKGNKVSDIMYGIELFKETIYFPLQSSADYRSSTSEALNSTPTMSSMANSGFTHQTVPNADNPIVLRAFDDVALEHIEKMANWVSLVLPIENLRKVFENVSREEDRNSKSIKSLIGERYGVEAQKYFEQWLTDINGGVMPQGAKSFLGKMFGRSKKVQVAAKVSVVAQQYFSIVRAMELVNPKYFTPFLYGEAKKTDMKQYEELLKHAPIAIIKEMGGFDVGSSGRVKDYIGYEGARKDAKYINKKIDDLSMWGAGAMDKLGWVTIWKAVKSEVAKEQKLKVGSDEFFEACRKRFTEVVVKTQVFDSVASRSGYMRSQRDLVKFATSFMGEPTAIMGRLFISMHNLVRAIKSGDKAEIKSAVARFGRTASVIAVSNILGNLAKTLWYAGRDDEEDEALLERWMRNFAEALRDDLNILNSLPFGRDLVSIIEGWDVERPDTTLIADMVTSAKRMLDDDITLDDSLNLVGSVGNFFGKPLKNVIGEIKSTINIIGDITDDIRPTDMGGAFVEGFTGKKRTTSESLYQAILSGSQGKVDAIKKGYKTDSAYLSALRTALKENDSRIKEAAKALNTGDIRGYGNYLNDIDSEGYFDEETIEGAIRAEQRAFNSKINEAAEYKTKGKDKEYKDIVIELRESYRGIYSQDEIVALIKKAQEEQLETEDDDTIEEETSIYRASDINVALEGGDSTLAKEIISELVSVKTENNLAKARKKAEDDGKTFNEKKAREEAESSAKSSVKSSMTSYWKTLYKEAYKAGNADEMRRIRMILKESGLYGKTTNDIIKVCKDWLNEK